MSTATNSPGQSATLEERSARATELTIAFTRAAFADPSLLDEIPNGVHLVLLPEGDPAHVEYEIELGLAALRRGENVYFRHVATDELERWRTIDTGEGGDGAGVGLRRTLFNWDGSIASQAMLGADGEWHPVDPEDQSDAGTS
jgi:hypothetical protein